MTRSPNWINKNEDIERYCRLQVRYGRHWAAIHPEGTIPGNLTEILLEDGETLTSVAVKHAWLIDVMAFESNMRMHAAIGVSPVVTSYTCISLENTLFYSGSAIIISDQLWVTRLVVHSLNCKVNSVTGSKSCINHFGVCPWYWKTTTLDCAFWLVGLWRSSLFFEQPPKFKTTMSQM